MLPAVTGRRMHCVLRAWTISGTMRRAGRSSRTRRGARSPARARISRGTRACTQRATPGPTPPWNPRPEALDVNAQSDQGETALHIEVRRPSRAQSCARQAEPNLRSSRPAPTRGCGTARGTRRSAWPKPGSTRTWITSCAASCRRRLRVLRGGDSGGGGSRSGSGSIVVRR